jgi:hypothetical protein
VSRAQWENTVRDVFGLSALPGLAQSFATDAVDSYFSNDGEGLSVSDQLRLDYERGAETMATRITADATLLAKLVPANAPADLAGRANAFIGELGQRVYRRPLTQPEIQDYYTLFQQAPMFAAMGADPFVAGATLVIDAMLQSPYFLYRVELTTGQGRTRLDPYELASKLSYALTDTMPDDTLFAAAASGALNTAQGLSDQANRILTAAGAGPSHNFHSELYALVNYQQITKDPMLLPKFTMGVAASMAQESQLFLDDVFTTGGALSDLLNAPYTFVDANLAPIYGVPAPGSGFARVTLDPTQRAGLLTRLGFLTEFADSVESDIIHRGVFVSERVLCIALPPPPLSTFPPLPTNLPTNRDRVEALTGKGTCGAACHGQWIDPAGNAFEHYGPLGAYRGQDDGQPVNSADTFPFTDGPQSYSDAISFSRALAKSIDTHECYARNWYGYLQARQVQAGDQPLIDWLAQASQTGLSIKGLVLAVVNNDSFVTRLP